ncbi:MliC family protein [Pseudoalteromonas sp. YIC-656]|uniref:MliC family protein n=1 Tax=Pseudoalteromonas pernae TaxID=3118054 RepID=UPI00324249D4
MSAQRIITLMLIIPLLCLFGCDKQVSDSAQKSPAEFFRCNTGAVFTVEYADNSAEIKIDSDVYQLNGERTASGAQFTHESMSFWSKGNDAILMINNETWHCHRSD